MDPLMLRSRASWLWNGIVDLLLPPRCAECGEGLGPEDAANPLASALCPPCRTSFDRMQRGGCTLCQAAPPAVMLGETERCGACAGRPSPLAACLASVAFRGDAES